MLDHLLDHLHDPKPSIEPERTTIDCPKCEGSGYLEYELDYFGRKTEWGRCNAKGCVGGEVEVEQEASC